MGVSLLLGMCFLFGVIIKTNMGQLMHDYLDKLTQFIPGYGIVKTTVAQFFNTKSFLFSSVALVQVSENGTLMTGFITDRHSDGRVTVFLPTGPNPTTGLILHIDPKNVYPVDVPVDVAFKSVISCGAGSRPLINSFLENLQQKQG